MGDERPMADPFRVEMALQMFPHGELSAEQWAARYAHTVGCSSFDQYRYPDPNLGAWIDELHRLFSSAAELERCRQTHLSPDEYVAVMAEIADAEQHGL